MSEQVDVLVFYSPVESTERVLEAVFAAGGGVIGDYEYCCWRTTGTGQFRPRPGAHPTIGEVGALDRVEEERVELEVPRARRDEVVAALREAHPYEEPAFHLIAVGAPLTSTGSRTSK